MSPRRSSAPRRPDGRSGDPVEILVVEDSPTQARQLLHLLELRGYRLSSAASGKEALLTLERRRPTLVITDVVMPEMDGYQLCRRIKADRRTQQIPVMLLTALSDAQDVVKGLECGADCFVAKPYEEAYLLSRIESVLANRHLPPSGPPQQGVEVLFAGRRRVIAADSLQILNFLLSAYEAAVQRHRELSQARDDLAVLSEQLEERVRERTATLEAEVHERRRVQESLRAKTEEIRAMSQQLWQAGKLASVGELAASIAHELNNPLATVSLRVEALLAQAAPGGPAHQPLDVIAREVERMSTLVANLLDFSRRAVSQISTINVAEETTKTLELIHYHLRNHRITVVSDFPPEAPLIRADRQQLRQVFLNLFTNASDAMPNGGTLTVRARAADPTRVLIEVADTGVGIMPEHLPKVMEPFFTTKPEGKGTGLGLAICRRIVQEHQGTIEVESELGRGTTVRVILPVASGSNGAFLKQGPTERNHGADA